MGWYVTCAICGLEAKYGPECDCYELETLSLMKRTKGCTIVDTKCTSNGWGMVVYHQLQRPEGDVFHLKITLSDCGGEMTEYRSVVEITADDYAKVSVE